MCWSECERDRANQRHFFDNSHRCGRIFRRDILGPDSTSIPWQVVYLRRRGASQSQVLPGHGFPGFSSGLKCFREAFRRICPACRLDGECSKVNFPSIIRFEFMIDCVSQSRMKLSIEVSHDSLENAPKAVACVRL